MLKITVFTFLTALLLLGVAPSISTVKAQGDVTVNIMSSVGGSTTPAAGTQTYNSGSSQSFAATPDAGFYLAFWTVVDPSGNVTTYPDATITLTLAAGTYTMQAVFQAFNTQIPAPAPSPNPASAAVVVVLASVGGTTTPAPGVYTLANAASLNLKATPLSGWVFDHWVIGGYPLSHGAYSFTDTPTDNPYKVDHGYGYTYSYQPVFSLASSTSASPTPTIPEVPSAALIAVAIALIALLIGSGVYAYRKRK